MLRPDTFALTALLGLLTAVGPLSTDMYLPALPEIGRLLSGSPAQVQLTLSAYLLGFALGQIVYGPLSDAHGRKLPLLVALMLFCAATVACMLANSIELLIVARAAQALGGSGTIVLARAIVRDLYSGARAARELALMGAVMALGPVAAPVIGGLFQTSLGWRATFAALLAAGAAALLVVWRQLPETLRESTRQPVSLRSMLASYRIIARHPSYLAHLGIAACAYAGLFAWISGASFVLQGLYGLEPFAFGVAFALASFGFLMGTTIAARLVVRIGIDRMIGLGAVALAAGGLCMMAAVTLGLRSAASLVLPAALYMVGLGLVMPQAAAGAMAPFPERAGTASSLLGFVQQCSAAICGAVVGVMLGTSAMPVAFGVAAMGSATLLIWALTRHLRAPARAT